MLNRITFCEWDKQLMGPINDEQGVEQGGGVDGEGGGTTLLRGDHALAWVQPSGFFFHLSGLATTYNR